MASRLDDPLGTEPEQLPPGVTSMKSSVEDRLPEINCFISGAWALQQVFALPLEKQAFTSPLERLRPSLHEKRQWRITLLIPRLWR